MHGPLNVKLFFTFDSHILNYIQDQFCTMLFFSATLLRHLCFDCYKIITSFTGQHRCMYTTLSLQSNYLLGKGKLHKICHWTYIYIKNKRFHYFSTTYLKKEMERNKFLN